MVDRVGVHTFHQQQWIDQIVLLVVANGSGVLLHRLFLPLILSICLQAESGRESVIDTEVGSQFVPDFTDQLCAAIRGDDVSYTALADHMFEKHSYYLWGVNALSAGQVNPDICQIVDDNKDPGVSRCLWPWQVGNQIHGNSLPGTTRQWQWHVKYIECMMRCFDSVAQLTAHNVLL